MQKKRLVILFTATLFLLLLSLTCLAQTLERWPFYSQFVDVDLEIGSGISVIKTRPDSVLDLAIANLTFVPIETERQKILSFESTPTPTKHTQHIEYIWHHPLTNELDFEISARMRRYNEYTKIPKKVGFPIVNLPPDIIPYTQPTSNINSNDEKIHEIASQLAEGEDDLFVVVYKIALWTKENINYSLSTLTAEVSQPASWVMENKQGVCDELTSLFIAMLRSIGIPAKFISGIAYTDLPEFPEKWGGHGWAEVYFPGYGWTDWDVTYGEFGFVDPTHFKLKESLDSDEPATSYLWQGRGVEAVAKEMKLKGKLLHKFGQISPRIDINTTILYTSTGLGSYNLVQADITNLEDSYISTILYLAPIQNIELITDSPQLVYFEPRQTKRLFWIIKSDSALNTEYIYTFPITVVSLRNVTSATSFVAMRGESMFTKKQMEDVIETYVKDTDSKAEAQLSMTCEADKNFYYSYDTPKVSCAVKNIGNTKLTDLNICLETRCESTSLKINQEKIFEYELETLNHGRNQLLLSAENNKLSKSFIFTIFVLDDPNILIKEVKAPKNVSYKQNFTIEILLEKVSTSNPQDVVVLFKNGGFEETWFIEDMTNNQRYLIDMFGSSLKNGNNSFDVIVSYTDLNSKQHSSEETFYIELMDVTLFERVKIFIRSLENGLRKLFK